MCNVVAAYSGKQASYTCLHVLACVYAVEYIHVVTQLYFSNSLSQTSSVLTVIYMSML